jgi:hypothetical protein
MTAEEKNDLKKKLPHNWAAILSAQTGFSKGYARRVICGKCDQIDIEIAALTLALECQKKRSEADALKKAILGQRTRDHSREKQQ